VPGEEAINHTCRRGYTSQNVLARCDFDMRFTFLVVGCPGSTHDTRVLNHALTNVGDEFPKPPSGKYYLVDLGYPNKNVIECSFGVLKQKWHILKSMPSFLPRRQKHSIIACMALHNFI
jgi:hypothetical protein